MRSSRAAARTPASPASARYASDVAFFCSDAGGGAAQGYGSAPVDQRWIAVSMMTQELIVDAVVDAGENRARSGFSTASERRVRIMHRAVWLDGPAAATLALSSALPPLVSDRNVWCHRFGIPRVRRCAGTGGKVHLPDRNRHSQRCPRAVVL